MDEILNKIDVLITRTQYMVDKYPLNRPYKARLRTLEEVKNIILSEAPESCDRCLFTKQHIDTYPCKMCPRVYMDKHDPIE